MEAKGNCQELEKEGNQFLLQECRGISSQSDPKIPGIAFHWGEEKLQDWGEMLRGAREKSAWGFIALYNREREGATSRGTAAQSIAGDAIQPRKRDKYKVLILFLISLDYFHINHLI